MNATPAPAKLKMRVFAVLDAFQNLDCIGCFGALVFAKREFVDIYFPADTAAMPAFVGNTFEFFVIARCIQLHFFRLRVGLNRFYHELIG